ncbi:MAG: AsmA family protein [Bradyrhizobium sp.]|nr:AsmA family protein [Bradyrhizobium sp.]
MKALKLAGAAIAALIVILALVLIVGIPSGFLTSAIQDRVERQTGYRLTIAGSTRISLWPTLNVNFSDLTLQDPKDRDGTSRITIDNLQADVTLSSAWSGHPHVAEIVVTKPVVYRGLLRERTLEAASRPTRSAAEAEPVSIDRVKIVDGAIVASNPHDRFEHRIDGINANAIIDAARKLKLSGTARSGETPLKFSLNAAMPSPPVDRQTIPLDFTLEAPGLLQAPLTSKAELHFNGPIVMFNSLSGALGDGGFTGWASVDLASKPLVKVDLDFQRLDLPASKPAGATASPIQGWSDAPINLIGLNYVDAQLRVSAAQLVIANAQFAPAAIDASLAAGVLKASFSNLGAYGGQAAGEVIVDASSGSPTYAMHGDIVGVRALPLLTSLADFDKIDGKMQAKIAAQSSGASQHAIMSNMSGTAFVIFQDGAIRGVNIAQMIRSLTASTLNGWQEQEQQATDLTQLSSSFKIDRGQAVTTDFNLVGPLVRVTGAGTIDLGTKQMGFRVEPKLVMTTEGQGRTSDPIGFGIPVLIEGPWSGPRIYPDMQGILDNPDAAYAKLHEMGKGLFGPNGANLGNIGGLLGGLSSLTGNPPTGNGNVGTASGNNSNDALGGNIAGTIGSLMKGFGGSRGIAAPGRAPAETPAETPSQQSSSAPDQAQAPRRAPSQTPTEQAQTDNPPPQDSQPMNDVLRQLFNRQ